ncbi:hypothetical protein BDR06DRAFT_873406, partial [Suillus hirtellus]
SDPVAFKSGFQCMYMKNHPDTLIAYVKYYRKVKGNGMTLVYELKSRQLNTSWVSFDPPLLEYEEVKPWLLSMKAEAQEGLGMLKAPQISGLQIPCTGVFAGILWFTYFYFLLPPVPDTTFLSISVTTVNAFFSPVHMFRNTTWRYAM